jgi:two-component system, OmpR family, sensor histidine kinase ChvG
VKASLLRRISPSRIALRLLAFNVLVVFVPVFGVLYLDVYETHLRQAQENAMAQQAAILAASLGEDATEPVLNAQRVTRVFDRLERRGDTRLRVYDFGGSLIGDSARSPSARPTKASYPPEANTRTLPLYRLGAQIANLARAATAKIAGWVRHDSNPQAVSDADAPFVSAEVRTALTGQYGAATRVTPGQRSLTMFVAVPVRRQNTIVGAVVASQSTYRILRTLYDVRLRVFRIVLASLLVAALLTGIAAATIVRPLARLEGQAMLLAGRRGRSPAVFPGSGRKDELGTLARALEELTRRTDDHIALLQTFAADVSHELKNPLASIRAAADTMAASASAEERAKFLTLMTRDVARLERLVSSLRDVARVEQQIATEAAEPVDLTALLREIVEGATCTAARDVTIRLKETPSTGAVLGSRERLAQVFENVISNAFSFAPDGTTVDVRIARRAALWVVSIEDRGPGIPDSHLERVFTRFFSYRPTEPHGSHVGLGLAIAKQIVESVGGSIAAANRDGGGARFDVELPAIF